MSLGIPLSQLISSNARPLTSGIPSLDKALDNGFYRRSIYEIFGVPGIGKTQLGKSLVNNMLKNQKDENILWIDTNKTVNMRDQQWISATDGEDDVCGNIFHVRIRKLSELIFYLQKLLNNENNLKYSLIIIDGFSQLLVNHLNIILNHGVDQRQLHDIKCKRLIVILTLLTKYAHLNNSIIVLIDDCMNTSYQWENNEIYSGIYNEDNLDILSNGNNFFVSDKQSLLKRKNVQSLKSSLIANCAMGNKDNSWEIYFKARIGLYWNWTVENDNFQDVLNKKNIKDRPSRCITAIISTNTDQNKKRYKTQSTSFRGISLTSSTSTISSSSFSSLPTNSNIFHSTLSESQLNEDIENGPIKFYYSNEQKKFLMVSNSTASNSNNSNNNNNNSDYPNKRQMINKRLSQVTTATKITMESLNIPELEETIYDSQG
ncbi:putative DNA-dependent ATPase RAD55 PWA37_003679 [Arxiozyma heterogenica]|uniref:putative DNA-dependent ATPase RAD55 n=1 Tax=Arxiozyma heterogenica TaxID=278026 RepID=UPI002F017C1C